MIEKIKRKSRSPFGSVEGYDKFLDSINGTKKTVTKSLQNDDETVTKCDKSVTQGRKTVTNGDKIVTNRDKTVTKQLRNCDKFHRPTSLSTPLEFNPDDLYKLSEQMKKIFFYIVESCKQRNSLTSHPIKYLKISEELGISHANVRQCVVRLKKQGLISTGTSKVGRGGYSSFEITESAKYHALAHLSILRNSDEIVTKQLQNPSIVSSSYINTTTNRTSPNLNINQGQINPALSSSPTTNIPEELQQIDCTPLEQIGFNESHIIQIHREHTKKAELALSAKVIQDSINALAYDLKHNSAEKDFRHSPAVVLTALLKKGMPYSSKTPEQFLTPQQEAMKNYLLAQEQQAQAQKEIESRIKLLELQKWQNSLTEEELLELCPESEIGVGVPDKIRHTMRRRRAIEIARDYFEAEVWAQKKKSIMSDLESRTADEEKPGQELAREQEK